jgi:hypothetical protein
MTFAAVTSRVDTDTVIESGSIATNIQEQEMMRIAHS